MINNENRNRFIELTELCEIIKAQDIRTAIRWCAEMDIPIKVIGKKRLVHWFLVEAELDKTIIQKFKKQDPENWEQLYKHYRNNDAFGYQLEIQSKTTINKIRQKTRATPKSRFAKEFMKE